MLERELRVDNTTIDLWVQRYESELEKEELLVVQAAIAYQTYRQM